MNLNEKLMQGYENTGFIRYDSVPENLPNTVGFDDLSGRRMSGVLKMNRLVDGKLVQTYSAQENHVGVIAATRLGKTTSYVVPTIISFAKQLDKRSLIISDPKGELYRTTSKTLRDEGYEVKLINFRDYLHSECWNPLTPIYRKYQKAYGLEKEIKVVQDGGVERVSFCGKFYATPNALEGDLTRMKSMLMEEVGNDVDNIAQMLITTEKSSDPYWEDSARELLKAFLWAMLEDSHASGPNASKKITEDTFSFSTILTIMNSMRDGNGAQYDDGGYFTDRGEDSRAYILAKNCIIENASTTRKCIVSEFNAKLSPFKDCAMRLITSCNTFEIASLTAGDKPLAIYIDYRDELKTHYQIISLFIQNAYTHLIDYANALPEGKLKVPFYFILDEFGNFPPITDIDTVISACGGRNIFFILILQSYAQLNNVYGRDIAEIIRDNLNVHVFFGSNNPGTLDEFSKECGQITRVSPLSALNGSGNEMEQYMLETIPLMPKSMLSNLQVGECIVTEANCGYVMFSKLERYYLCEQLSGLEQASEKDYVLPVNPLDKRYTYKVTKHKRNPFDF